MTPSFSTQLKFMCGHIIHEEESKLVKWGVTQAKVSSKNNKGGLHKDLHKYLHKELHNYLHNFWGVKAKNSEWGNTFVQIGVTKPSVTSTKDLKNNQRGSINKWHPPKHQGGPVNYELGSIIPT